jgi:hypothetical protein
MGVRRFGVRLGIRTSRRLGKVADGTATGYGPDYQRMNGVGGRSGGEGERKSGRTLAYKRKLR